MAKVQSLLTLSSNLAGKQHQHHKKLLNTSAMDTLVVDHPSVYCCHCLCQPLSNDSVTNTLRSSSASCSLSHISCNSNSCIQSDNDAQHSCEISRLLPDIGSVNFTCHHQRITNGLSLSTSQLSKNEDNALRYSYKGIPPELYSAKKEFIYTRPLVEKQLVLKKTCEWWFYKTKCNSMSTHWKQNAFLILTTCILILLGLIIFLCLPVNENTEMQQPALTKQTTHLLTTTAITTTTTTTTDQINYNNNNNNKSDNDGSYKSQTTMSATTSGFYDLNDLQTSDINQTIEMGDEDWSTEEDDMENDIEHINNSIPEELASDYVTPIKVDNFSLNADDLLYESKRNLNNNNNKDYFSAFSATGTFRSKSSQIWDPHPEYILNTFGHRLHLILHQDTSFIPPKTFRVINILNNRTEEEEQEEGHYLGCYYKGHVEGDEQSAVAVSLCHGMTGYIKTSFGSLLIQPLNQTYDSSSLNISAAATAAAVNGGSSTTSTSSEIVHKVWRHSRRNARHAVSMLDNNDFDFDFNQLEQNFLPKLKRRKRDYEDRHLFTIELLVAVDRTMIEFHKHDLNSYILTLISIVSNIFADASIGNSIYISVANILVLHDYKRARRRGPATTASQSLKDFCSHVTTRGYHYDTAMLITRDQICRKERETKCDTLGLAELGTVCRRSSCSIVQDNGLPAAFTIAHELGHILNMPHDDDDRCKKFNSKPGTNRKLHIMSSVMGDDIHPWSWSDCSRYYVSEFLEKEDKTCLEDTPTKFIPNYNTRLPGEIYSLDHQCKLIHGNQSRYCHIETDCKRLWCKTHDNNSDCRSSNLPWADGTPCNGMHYWCQKGECVPREGNTRQVINGGWGSWTPFTPCSLTCGGGVQESQRECNNPLPKNGGKYCTGARKKYRSCNTQNCPTGSMDAREQQCYQMNGRDFGIKAIGVHTKWIPKYGLPPKEKCNLYCRAEGNTGYFRLSEKVIDGTTCSFDSFDKCVNGICRPAGCDNELNSLAKLDKCGICEGRNDTCEEYTGNFYVSDLYRVQPKYKTYYYHVITIPKGASNIVIEQPGYRDENYIVLRDDQGKSLLNGDNVIIAFRNVSYYAGVAYEYNGSKNPIERVNTTYTRKLKRDLVVEIISMITNAHKDNETLLMTYTYTMDKTNYLEHEVEIYRWEMQQWSNCDALCHGSMYRLPVCVSTIQALKVAPQFCDPSAKPNADYRVCNTECLLTLNVTSISECSSSCGLLGTREKTYHCIQNLPDMGRSNIVDLKYCASKFEFDVHEECREGCWRYKEWTPCSKTCGLGVQTRSIACYFNQTFVPDEYCNLKTKANYRETTRICNQENCQQSTAVTKVSRAALSQHFAYNWWTSDWGACDANCEKNRTVVCRNPFGNACPADKKPLSKRKCCAIKYVSNWSNCSVQCGNGVRRKELHCARVYKPEIKGTPRRREFIDSSYCRHLRVPKPKRTHKVCKISCKWSVTNWSPCQADCSDDYQSRSVYCESAFGNPINLTNCDESKKPPERKICNNCIKREYKTLSDCNCEGNRRRRMLCYDSQRRRLPCPTKEKIFREKCTPPRHCHPTSCYDIRRFLRTYEDREYTIYVRSMPKKIYCHDMSTSPKEFVTVNATENYSIYYDNKTYHPDKCPPESRDLEFSDKSSNPGRTSFRKIRIDLTTLRIDENDFTFAESRGRPQSYGSAGDCYNRRKNCPQGDFSINLEHTGFHLRHGTVWEPYGHHVVMKESSSNSRMSYRALCGGWCGGCRIAGNSALYLDV